jgi:cytochrome c553
MAYMRTLLALVTLAGCQLAAEPRRDPPPAPPRAPDRTPTEPPEPPAKRFEHDMMVRYHMHENLDLARAIEHLLVNGKLDDARGLAHAIALGSQEPDLGPWTEEAALVRTRAAALAEAPSIDEGCRRAAQLAGACVACHVEARVQPELRSPPRLPPDGATVASRMARHHWAADRMWEGLIAGDEDTWRAGLAVMTAPPHPWSEIDERAGFARRLQSLATDARAHGPTDSLADRTRVYGEILVTCAGCHAVKQP